MSEICRRINACIEQTSCCVFVPYRWGYNCHDTNAQQVPRKVDRGIGHDYLVAGLLPTTS
jgi:hypothetical protein